ncbi:pre-mRNA-splicing factor CWC22 homolog [Megalopta genalis]|uniref:pre-mRNA-splicing factor CWC22 homolog n=1 Tax=Megalopta genalis TaxID=115081 RepID=UPI003FD527CC
MKGSHSKSNRDGYEHQSHCFKSSTRSSRSNDYYKRSYDYEESYAEKQSYGQRDVKRSRGYEKENRRNDYYKRSYDYEESYAEKQSYGQRDMKRSRDCDKENTRKEEKYKVTKKSMEKRNEKNEVTTRQKKTIDLITSKTGGAYIPPAKLKMMQAEITDKSGVAYQRIAWEALKKSIHGTINKVNVSNIGLITRELLKENIVRGRGLLARSIIQAQAASPTFNAVYAALTAIINSKFPNIGELVLKRLVIQFKRGFRRNNKPLCIASGTFIAHLINQRVAHEILALEILTLLVETPTDDSIEVAIAFLKECGMKLTEVTRKGIEAIFEMLRNILHEGQLDKRIQYMIEVMFQVRKDGFKDHEAVLEELDLVEEDNQFTHLLSLDEAADSQDTLNVFKFDMDYVINEDKYKQLSKEILGSDVSGSESEEYDEEESSDEDSSTAVMEEKEDVIVDNTESNLTALRRTIYLTIHSSLDFEECAHKLMKMQLKPGQETELCHMFLDCCAEMRTYEKFFGLLAGRFCAINKIHVTILEQIFQDSYHTIHRLDTNKLRNVSKFFAHLLFTDSISWEVLSCIKLTEDDTTSSNRIFIKILFQELSEYIGLCKLNQRIKDVTLQEAFEGLFPRDEPKNTRFAINFFTSIGLGGLTNDLREHLKNLPKPTIAPVMEQKPESASNKISPSSSSRSSPFTSSSSLSSSSSSDDSDASSEKETKRKKKIKNERRKKQTIKESRKKHKRVKKSK